MGKLIFFIVILHKLLEKTHKRIPNIPSLQNWLPSKFDSLQNKFSKSFVKFLKIWRQSLKLVIIPKQNSHLVTCKFKITELLWS